MSLSGGESWQSRTTLGSVQFRVIGTKGIRRISNRDALVSGGQCSWQDVSIAIAGEAEIVEELIDEEAPVTFPWWWLLALLLSVAIVILWKKRRSK